MSDIKFVTGLYVNPPHEKAPDFVKAGISIKPQEFIGWLKEQAPNDKGYVRLQVKESRDGKWYASVDTYVKTDSPRKTPPAQPPAGGENGGGFKDDDIPF